MQTSHLVNVDKVGNRLRILSPVVGYFSSGPAPGILIEGGGYCGLIQRLNSSQILLLPEGLAGRVSYDQERDRAFAVEYSQELFILETETIVLKESKQSETGAESELDTDSARHVVRAFTSGIFYAKPAPDSPSYVAEGDSIDRGGILGLIEVMKTFNQVMFQGTGNHTTGRIIRILVEDGQEVTLGQPLFLIN